jgi:hypothetical protein
VSREDVDFFQNLESHMRSEDPPLAGRDHLIYRGYYVPVKGVIDGDLCERFSLLPNDKKQMIAGELDRSVREIERKISVCSHHYPHILMTQLLTLDRISGQDLLSRYLVYDERDDDVDWVALRTLYYTCKRAALWRERR